MDERAIANGLIQYFCLVILITFHEFGHAWMSWKRGDDTAHQLGRVSLNPLVHMEFFGTFVLPIMAIFLAASGSALSNFIIGWGKPVPVDSSKLKNRGFDWVLVAMAGPFMNVVLGVVAIGLLRLAVGIDSVHLGELAVRLAIMNFALCFFNLIPVPPLDGSHLLRYFIGMSEETFLRISQYGFFIVVVLMQIPHLRFGLGWATQNSVLFLMRLFGISP